MLRAAQGGLLAACRLSLHTPAGSGHAMRMSAAQGAMQQLACMGGLPASSKDWSDCFCAKTITSPTAMP